MRFCLTLAALAPILSVYADNIFVTVGADNKLAFSPSNVTAKIGDTIAFQFQSNNHSVTQSTFAAPCTKQGIDSGFQFVAPGSTSFPQFSFNVTDVAPLWFFCAQTTPANHCGGGMVFSVNADPTSAKSFVAFQALAMGGAAASSIGSDVGGAVATATSAIASGFNQATSALPSVLSDATSAIGGAVQTAASEIPNIVNDATSAIGGAAGAAASEGAKLFGAGVRVGPSTGAALLLAGAVLAREMLL